jgi:hypothetical protein
MLRSRLLSCRLIDFPHSETDTLVSVARKIVQTVKFPTDLMHQLMQ